MSRRVLVTAAVAGVVGVLIALAVGPRVTRCATTTDGGPCETLGGTDPVVALLVGLGGAALVVTVSWVLDGRRR